MSKRVPLIVLTGGPCGFKSAGQRMLAKRLPEYGVNVICLKEPDTLVHEMGVDTAALVSQRESQLAYETNMLRLQLVSEKVALDLAWHSPAERVAVIGDRGVFDCEPYMGPEAFTQTLRFLGLTEEEVLSRYHAVLHLVSLAQDAPQFYNLDNPRRTETPEQARKLDELTKGAWGKHPHWRLIPNILTWPNTPSQPTVFGAKMDVLFREVCWALSRFYGEPIGPGATRP